MNVRQTIKAGKSRLKHHQSCTVHTLAYDILRRVITVRAAAVSPYCYNNH
jgi:hypothetical protein